MERGIDRRIRINYGLILIEAYSCDEKTGARMHGVFISFRSSRSLRCLDVSRFNESKVYRRRKGNRGCNITGKQATFTQIGL